MSEILTHESQMNYKLSTEEIRLKETRKIFCVKVKSGQKSVLNVRIVRNPCDSLMIRPLHRYRTVIESQKYARVSRKHHAQL